MLWQWFSICCSWMWLQRSQWSIASSCRPDLFDFDWFRVDDGKNGYTTLPKSMNELLLLLIKVLIESGNDVSQIESYKALSHVVFLNYMLNVTCKIVSALMTFVLVFGKFVHQYFCWLPCCSRWITSIE